MTLLRWDKRYLVGQAQIDREHQELFNSVNEFYVAFMLDQDRRRVLALLDGLVDYTRRHFASEDAMMKESGFPGLEAHRAQHVKMFEQVFALQEKFREPAANPTHATVQFLRSWLNDHILQHDLVFGAYLGNLQKKPGNATPVG